MRHDVCPTVRSDLSERQKSTLFQILLLLFFFYSAQESKISTQFAVYGSNTPLILKQSQGHQTWHVSLDPHQGYNHAKFEIPLRNSAWEKANAKVLVKSGIMSFISFESCKSQNLWYVHDLDDVNNSLQSV